MKIVIVVRIITAVKMVILAGDDRKNKDFGNLGIGGLCETRRTDRF